MKKIESFRGEYRFLSNFWPAKVFLEGEEYSSTEHAYQAAKTLDLQLRKEIQMAGTPGQAKKLGQKLVLQNDWESVKLSVMEDLLLQKFSDPLLKQAVLNTGKLELIELNTWNDCFWGVCNGEGKNHLGKLLMKVRELAKCI